MSSFGQRFKILRQQKKLTQEDFANALSNLGCPSITKYSISQYENNKQLPEVETLIIICDYLEVSIDYLLRGKH